MENVHLSPRELNVLQSLFLFRGGTVQDISKHLYGDIHNNSSKNVYRYLRTLRKFGLLDGYSLFLQEKAGQFYFLSKEGLELAHLYYKIPDEYIGEGYGQDHGDFTYGFYKPPQRYLKHHMLTVDFLVQCELVEKETGEHTFSYRDNRYASKKFKENEVIEGRTYERTFRIRPDAEIRFYNKEYWAIEIDLSNERQVALIDKFASYARYMRKYFSENKRYPYSTILFVAETKERTSGFTLRWASLLAAFQEGMGEYAEFINLKYVHVHEVQKILHDHIHAKGIKEKTLERLDEIITHDDYVGTEIGRLDKRVDYTYRSVPFSITVGKHQVLYTYYRLNGLETNPWTQMKRVEQHFHSKLKMNPSFKGITKSFYILCYNGNAPSIINQEALVKKSNISLDRILLLNLDAPSDEAFSSSDGRKIKGNPLVYVDEEVVFR